MIGRGIGTGDILLETTGTGIGDGNTTYYVEKE
jgi:hypothetical protein